MCCSQQRFQEPNLFGHVYDGQTPPDDGYAVCTACGCRENTLEAAKPCPETMVGRRLAECAENVYPLKTKDKSFLVVKVGCDDHPATQKDLDVEQERFNRILGDSFNLPIVVTHHNVTVEVHPYHEVTTR